MFTPICKTFFSQYWLNEAWLNASLVKPLTIWKSWDFDSTLLAISQIWVLCHLKIKLKSSGISMTQRFSNVYSLYYKPYNLKFGTSFIIFHYDIFSRKIKYQNIITSNLKFSFIMSKCDDYPKHINIQ